MNFPRHERYYLEHGNVNFVVDRTHFKIHRFFFERDSEVFRNLLHRSSLQPGADGETVATAISPEYLHKDEFVALLDFFYEGMYPNSAPKSILEWTHLLSISTNFKFSRLRELAIQELSTKYAVHPVEKLVLSRTYDIPDWFQSAFEELVKRVAGPRDWEAEKLGLETTVSIYTAREDARRGKEDVDKCGIAGPFLSSADSLSPSSSPRDFPAEQTCSVQPSETGPTQYTPASVTSGEDSTSVHDEQHREDGAPSFRMASMSISSVTKGTIFPWYSTTIWKDPDFRGVLSLQTISAMSSFSGYSLEELRVQDYQEGRKPSSLPDRPIVAPFRDEEAEARARLESEKVKLQEEIARLRDENVRLRLDRTGRQVAEAEGR